MKKLLVGLLLISSLSGCALYDAYFMARFDNNEYALINRIRTEANLGAAKCGKPEVVAVVDNIYRTSIEFRNYGQSIPRNQDVIRMGNELAEIVKGLSDRYHGTEPVSMMYCTTKFSSIERNAVNIQNVVGKKPR
jgi:hypothetical protein